MNPPPAARTATHDPATGEPPAARPSVWALAGGKGGVGRSLLAANLGIQLARSGRRVVLVDLDLLGGNLHVYLGYQRLAASLGDVAAGRVALLPDVACETPISHLRLVGGLQRAEIREDPVAFVRRVAEQFAGLSADHVIIDCGSGRSAPALAAFSEAAIGILVTTPEPAAIEGTYLFAEAYLRWCLVRALTGERMAAIEARLRESGVDPGRLTFRAFMSRLRSADPAARDEVSGVVRRTRLELILNQVRGEADEEAAGSLASGFRKAFGLGLHTAGIVEHDLSVLQSVQKRRSLAQQYPNAVATKAIARAATRLMASAPGPLRDAEVEWEDLDAIDHYRALELVPKASPKEVQSSYQLLKKTYDPETTHLAPIIEAPGLRELQARIEAAYRALIFLESRATYDRQLLDRGSVHPDQVRGLHAGPAPESAAAPIDEAGGGTPAVDPPVPAPEVAAPPAPRSGGPGVAEGHSGERLPESGADLRRERERRQLTIESIAEKTKIRPAHLAAIEEERFADLPAPVFVRGFLKEYARCVGLSGETFARSYMKRYQDWHESRRHPSGASPDRSGA